MDVPVSHRGSRRVYPAFLPAELCSELCFIQRSLAVVGYRPHVQSLTLYELLLAAPQLLPAVARARQLIWDAVEEHFGCACAVWPETTSLISWTTGASIGWHHDANRPYLAARHFSAVAYLNTQGVDFEGGAFCFQSGAAPLQVQPRAGTLLLYTADDSNVHSVQAVTAGERSTLTLWLTLDPEHREDSKVLSKLGAAGHPSGGLPPTMYVLQSGADVRVARLQQRLGVNIRSVQQAQLPTQQQQQQALQEGGSAAPWQQHPDMQQQGSDQQQEQAVVECVVHPPAPGCCNVQCVFGSMHEAVMTMCMLEWMVSSAPPPAEACTTQAHVPSASTGSDSGAVMSGQLEQCKACALLAALPQAAGRLRQYLETSSRVYERLLPSWQQLDALVAAE